MRCPECSRQRRPHIVTLDRVDKTVMVSNRFWDNDDQFHDHDGNTTTYVGLCSMGHPVSKKEKRPCPVKGCDFQKSISQVETEKANLQIAAGELPGALSWNDLP